MGSGGYSVMLLFLRKKFLCCYRQHCLSQNYRSVISYTGAGIANRINSVPSETNIFHFHLASSIRRGISSVNVNISINNYPHLIYSQRRVANWRSVSKLTSRKFSAESKNDKYHLDQLLKNVLNSELRGSSLEASQLIETYQRRQRISSKRRNLENVDDEEKPLTLEKKLLNLMEMWKMNEAVDLLVESLRDGITPNSGVILDLLQQLANLGEVDNILEVHDELLKGKNTTREVRFYKLLTEAYCNSGRVEEGVAMLRIIYHKTRNFSYVDPFFTMVTLMVLENFEHHLYLVKDFVLDLTERDPPVNAAQASMWKCLVLTERFQQADDLLAKNETLLKLIPAQVSDIVNAQFYMPYNKDIVLSWLRLSPHIKQPLKSAVLEALIEHKCKDNRWQEAFDCLREAMGNEETSVKKSTLTLFLGNFLGQLSEVQVVELETWANVLEEDSEPPL